MVSTTNTNTKMLGPFYKVYHTSNKDSKTIQPIKKDLDRLFINDNSSKDPVTYAGYGFSGSGKTSLIEGEENEDGSGYKSIINQIKEYLSNKNAQNITAQNITIKVYEDMKIYDNDCNFNAQQIYDDEKNPINKEPKEQGS